MRGASFAVSCLCSTDTFASVVLEPFHEVNAITTSISAVLQSHPKLARATVVLFVENNGNKPHAAAIANGVQRTMFSLSHIRITVFSEHEPTPSEPIPAAGFALTNPLKGHCVNGFIEFLTLDSVLVGTPFLGTDHDLTELKRQLCDFEYEFKERPGRDPLLEYSGKRQGADDRAVVVIETLTLAVRWMQTLAPRGQRRRICGNMDNLQLASGLERILV